MKKRSVIFLILFLLCLGTVATAQTVRPSIKGQTSFAIIADEVTFSRCRQALTNYKNMLEREGLPTFIIARRWRNPEEVKAEIQRLYRNNNLEGVVFVGDVPIAMIRQGQHLTSAFKMNEERFPMLQSSVPSDRFYDDFDLKFEFIKRDSANPLLFYYNLTHDSPQAIQPNIYSGRIKPSGNGNRFQQITNYLNKVVAERSRPNYLDYVVSYTGDGSFSNSLVAWADEKNALKEQLPHVFQNSQSAKFYNFFNYPNMKEIVINELRREEVDLMLFHLHGLYHRIFLNGRWPTQINLSWGNPTPHIEAMKLDVRLRLRRHERLGNNIEESKKALKEQFGFDDSWFEGAFCPEIRAKDSIEELMFGIVLEDVWKINPNPRIVIFDACFNGDFKEDEYIAGNFIFADGKTIVSIANSVNVLQDRLAICLIGLLGKGVRVGAWMQQNHILESHVIGDPTHFFTPKTPNNWNRHVISNNDPAFWMNQLETSEDPNIQSLALHKLFRLNAPNMSDILADTYFSSPHRTVRLQCVLLLPFYSDENYYRVIIAAVNDPHEFIRRKAIADIGLIGKPELLGLLIGAYLHDYSSERVTFNVHMALRLFDPDLVAHEIRAQLALNPHIFDRAGKEADIIGRTNRSFLRESNQVILDRDTNLERRISNVSFLRNSHTHTYVDDFLIIIKDDTEDVALRQNLIEALGWFTKSHRKNDIMAACKEIMAQNSAPVAVLREAEKTYRRLSVYSR